MQPGTRFGHYEILSAIGKGGMGEVYLARDEKLGRDVAVKVLPEIFVSDAERVSRLEREARLLAVLNHPSIAAVGEPRVLPIERIFQESTLLRAYDIMPDGKNLLVLQQATSPSGPRATQQIHVILNWFEVLKDRVPPN